APSPMSLGELEWWQLFPDETLQSLIREALAANYDLRIAAARILEARAQVTIARSFQFPVVNGAAAAPYQRIEGQVSSFARAGQRAEVFGPRGRPAFSFSGGPGCRVARG